MGEGDGAGERRGCKDSVEKHLVPTSLGAPGHIKATPFGIGSGRTQVLE